MTSLLSDLIGVSGKVFPGYGKSAILLRVKLVAAGLRHRDSAATLLHPAPGASLARAVAGRPELAGNLVWPYQNATWDVPTRIARLCGHYEVVDGLPPLYQFGIDEKLLLMPLDSQMENVSICLDSPRWASRDGAWTLSIFAGTFRAFSISFSLYRENGLTCFIGGIQGRPGEEAAQLYRDMTHAFHGIRPRDFVIEALRCLCRALKVDDILGIRDAAFHQRHPFFKIKDIPQDYDRVWADRGGVAISDDQVRLPLLPLRKTEEDIPAKKRKMYRQRFELLDRMLAEADAGFPNARTVAFDAT